jgi:hypothetical protein
MVYAILHFHHAHVTSFQLEMLVVDFSDPECLN